MGAALQKVQVCKRDKTRDIKWCNTWLRGFVQVYPPESTWGYLFTLSSFENWKLQATYPINLSTCLAGNA